MDSLMYGMAAVLRAAQIVSTVYAAVLSAQAIAQLQEYDGLAQKASRVSTTAASDRAQTQRSQALGVLSTALSAGSLVFLMVQSASHGGALLGIFPGSNEPRARIWLYYLNAAVSAFTANYLKNYWQKTQSSSSSSAGGGGSGGSDGAQEDTGLARFVAPETLRNVPIVGDYMDAWSKTRALIGVKVWELGLWFMGGTFAIVIR